MTDQKTQHAECASRLSDGLEVIPDWIGGFLNRRVVVEQELFDCASGKRPLPTAEQCREMALRLDVPDEYRMPPAEGANSNAGLATVDLWHAICEEAECVVLPGNNGGKRLLLTEEMCVRMGAALGC